MLPGRDDVAWVRVVGGLFGPKPARNHTSVRFPTGDILACVCSARDGSLFWSIYSTYRIQLERGFDCRLAELKLPRRSPSALQVRTSSHAEKYQISLLRTEHLQWRPCSSISWLEPQSVIKPKQCHAMPCQCEK